MLVKLLADLIYQNRRIKEVAYKKLLIARTEANVIEHVVKFLVAREGGQIIINGEELKALPIRETRLHSRCSDPNCDQVYDENHNHNIILTLSAPESYFRRRNNG